MKNNKKMIEVMMTEIVDAKEAIESMQQYGLELTVNIDGSLYTFDDFGVEWDDLIPRNVLDNIENEFIRQCRIHIAELEHKIEKLQNE